MKLRTLALWAALGMATSTAAALAIPAPAAPAWPSSGGAGGATADPVVAVASRFTAGQTLMMDGRLGHAALAHATAGASGPAETFLLASVTGADSPGAAAAPLNLAIVIDRSGSMKGARIANAIEAAVGIVERMRDEDHVTVVAFDTTAQVIVPLSSAGGASRPFVEAAIRNIRLGADTCLSCGLQTAMAELSSSSSSARDHVDRMILLSDGEANQGVKDVVGLRAMAGRMRDRGTSITTMGVDVDFDEKVMAAIASESNGRHYFVPNAAALPSIFEQEFDSLLATVARDSELEVHLAPGVEAVQVFDRSFRREGSAVMVPFGTFSAKQEKTVLMKLRVPADRDGSVAVASMKLRYRDLIQRTDGTCEGDLALLVTDEGHAQHDLDPFVAARVARSETAQALTTANALFEQGRVREAETVLATRRSTLHHAAALASAVAQARPIAPTPRKASGAFADDFNGQLDAVGQAEQNFAPPPPQAPGVAAAPAQAAEEKRAGKAATRQNQAAATQLSF
jgi:Ca-activated chloride channel family protein